LPNRLNVGNTPPRWQFPGNQVIDEGMLWNLAASAVDDDVPAQALTYALEPGAPAGLTLDGLTGLLTWTPSESQGPSVYGITLSVTDSGEPPLSAFTSFSVTVREANNPPMINPPNSATVAENTLLDVMVQASDPDPDVQTLHFSLDPGAPEGLQIDVMTGRVTWTPTEAQGPGNYLVTLRVRDDGEPPLSAEAPWTVFVSEINSPPSMAPMAMQLAYAGERLGVQVVGQDMDLPAQQLTYDLEPGSPDGAELEPLTGFFQWTPGSERIDQTVAVGVRITDSGSPRASAKGVFQIRVIEKIEVSLERDGSALLLRAEVTPGVVYQAEYREQLGHGAWQALEGERQAESGELSWVDQTDEAAQRFYRVRRVSAP
jgi:hypothetical protein